MGAILRTAEGLGAKVILTGYTPYPRLSNDTRLPHLADKITKQIAKTALGAERDAVWQQNDDIFAVLAKLKQEKFVIAALEQAPNSLTLPGYAPPLKIAIIVGREVEGVESAVLEAADIALEIPMSGQKESFNVSNAAAMALYHCKFHK